MIINDIRNNYSFIDKVELGLRVLYTKLFYPQSRLIRRGFIVRGRHLINFGIALTTGSNCRIEAFITGDDKRTKIKFGDRVQINDNVHISALYSVEIGNDVLIASHVYISDNSHGYYKGDNKDVSPYIVPVKRPYYVAQVTIGDRVWIGEGVIIFPGVSIGEGSIIGAHSIVTSDVSPNSIAVGSPAKVIKIWDEHKQKWVKC